jgi:hypothetical protein
MKRILLLFLSLLPFELKAQTGMLLPVVIVGSDTFPAYQLQDVVVVSKRTFKDPLEQSRFNQLKRNVLIVYPYAKEAGAIFREVNEHMASLEKNRDRKKIHAAKRRGA